MTQRHGGIIGIDHDAGGAGETITTFTSDGIFTPHSTQDVDFLCIAGGGAGAGAGTGSGGGGAGGYRSSWQEDPDTYTQLLIQSDTTDGSTTFTDSSSTGHTITAYGDTHHETDQKKFGDTSIHFDGTGDYLTIPAHNDWDFGTGPYTIECWIKTSAGSGWIINQANSDTGIRFCVGANGTGSAGTIQMNEQVSNLDSYLNGSTDISDGAWHHVVVTRGDAGSATKIYVDGTLDATGSTHSKNFDNDNVMYIGTRAGHGGNYFNGYIEELRISKSQRYTRNFTVATGSFPWNSWPFPLKEDPLPLTKGTGYPIKVGDGGNGGGEDNYYYGRNPIRILSGTSRGFGDGHPSSIGGISDSYTKFILSSGGHADGNTTFTDLSQSSHTITANGNVHHEEDQHYEMHGTAIYFDGTGDWLSLPTSSDWAMGTGDFTIECWFRQDASPSGKQAIFDTRISSRDETTGFSFGIHNNGSFYIYNNGNIPITTSSIISADTWYHVAVTRTSGTFLLFLDGVQKQYSTPTERDFTNTQAKIGVRPDNSGELFEGYLDELRVSKGIARYKGGTNSVQYFTPPYNTHNSITSQGGARAGSGASGQNSGWHGGSGGGGSYTSIGGYGTETQGYGGGAAKHFGGSGYGGGGGGGASAPGAASTGTNSGGAGDVGGDGGAGRTSTISGSSVTYAGGGGGGHRLAQTNAAEPGDGGAGGGGNGNGGGTHGTDGTGGLHGNGADGTTNTGGGGGGSGGTTRSWQGRINDEGGDGGSGIVIMREPAVTNTSGVYNMDDVFRYVSDGKW